MSDMSQTEMIQGAGENLPHIDLSATIADTLIAGADRKSVDDWLNSVDYDDLNDGSYVPSVFALTFMNFIKLVNGEVGETNKTPPVHLKMLDKIVGEKDYIVNLCFRGAAKTTLFFEYMFFFVAWYGGIPGWEDFDSMIYVSDSMDNGVKSARKNIEFRYNQSEFLQTEFPPELGQKFTDNYIHVKSREGKQMACKMFGAKTGLRGTKIFGKRPKFCVLDDLIGDDAANSKAEMEAIKNTVHKGVEYALDPKIRKVIFNGTPFNQEDIIIEAVESGSWDVNVWPVCERFPCTREEFRGAWDDRFSYDEVMKMYTRAVLNGKLDAFMQEMMLRISSAEERLIQDEDIHEYSREKLLAHRSSFNFYITTDFATSEKQKADFSVISVWAYNANGQWFWVDGICEKQNMSDNIRDLFRLVQKYSPQSVGVEVTGQQGAFINWIQDQMMEKNIWFNLASDQNGNKPGIRPITNKLSRFNLVVPLFKAQKILWPKEMMTSSVLGNFMQQIKLATRNGLKGKDDCLDTISMLMYLKPWKPSQGMGSEIPVSGDDMYHNPGPVYQATAYDSYIT